MNFLFMYPRSGSCLKLIQAFWISAAATLRADSSLVLEVVIRFVPKQLKFFNTDETQNKN